ncbi:hypothetical protein KWH94_06975 [Citrobacter cronae]|uniref:hypothetical protein n=1 Tax=Citrobacter cronae TaxID=1748967 RepID=UPI0021D37642|nr:hypothetical protein [Citrobacter cronae]MCU6182866.1 hypothetical protein [Citrobacter cronae]
MSKIRVKEISHPGDSATFQSQDPISGEWTDVLIRSGNSNADISDYNKRVSDWIADKKQNGVDVIKVPNY